MIAAESARQWIDMGDAFRGGANGIVNRRVARWPNDFKIGNPAVAFDAYFREDGTRVCWIDIGRLRPLAVETVVQHAAVPTELRLNGRAAAVSAAAAAGCSRFLSARRFVRRRAWFRKIDIFFRRRFRRCFRDD